MKKATFKIRNGVFETNSSSIHVIAISKNRDKSQYIIPEVVNFTFGCFGWEVETYSDTGTLASYLYTAAASKYLKYVDYDKRTNRSRYDVTPAMCEWMDKVEAILLANGVKEVTFDYIEREVIDGQPIAIYEDTRTSYYPCNYWYIDHSYDLENFVDNVVNDEGMLLAYLFGCSYIETGNDNSDDYPPYDFYNEDEYDIIDKGN